MIALIIKNNTCETLSLDNLITYKYFKVEDNIIYLFYNLKFKNKKNTTQIKNGLFRVYDNNNLIFELLIFNKYENVNVVNINRFCINSSIVESKYLDLDIKLIIEDKIQANYTNYLFLNHKKYENELLKDFDLIEYLNIKIIYFKTHLVVYSSDLNIKDSIINLYKKIITIEYKYNTFKFSNSYISEFKIEDIENFKIEKPKKQSIRHIGPSITMSLGMISIALINYYSNYNLNINSIIMPIIMLVSSIFWPFAYIVYDKLNYNNQIKIQYKNYLKYLINYRKKLNIDYKNYLSSINLNILLDQNIEDTLLFKNNEGDLFFLKVYIGKYIKDQNKINLINNKMCDTELVKINKDLDNVYEYKYIDILEARYITIVNFNKYESFNYFLFSIMFNNSYDDFIIAIFSKEMYLYNKLYNNAFINYKGYRYYYDSINDLIDLDNNTIDKKIVLFLLDEVDYKFNNDNIYVLYFTNKNSSLYKDSKCVINIHDTSIYLYYDKLYKLIKFDNFKNYDDVLNIINLYKRKDFKFNFHVIAFIKNLKIDYLHHDLKLITRFAYNSNSIFELDLHESKDGPHGLICGTTGSGKTELIVSLLIGLMFNYPPRYLNIILIDFKGESIKNELIYDKKLPKHIIGTISNLELSSIDRLLTYIENEIIFRQKIFLKLANLINKPISNIDDYISNNKDLDNIAHLLIVVDEFAEVKDKVKNFIDKIISFARIGRSLGIHLILSTQKPQGIIDEQIRTNINFKISLRANSIADSQDVIDTKDAYYLSKPGEFYIKSNQKYIKAKAIYGRDDIEEKGNNYIARLNIHNSIIKKIEYPKKTITSINNYLLEEINNESKNYQRKNISFKSIDFIKDNKSIIGAYDDYLNSVFEKVEISNVETILIYDKDFIFFKSLINQVNLNNKTIYIGNKKEFDFNNHFNLEDFKMIEKLFNKIQIEKKETVFLFIEDLFTFINYDEKYYDLLLKVLKLIKNMNVKIVANTSNIETNFKIFSLFQIKVLILNKYNRENVSSFFKLTTNYKEEKLIMIDNEIYPFVPIKNDIKDKVFKDIYLKEIEEKVCGKVINNKVFIGYDNSINMPLFLEDTIDLLIISNNQRYLDIYLKYFKHASIVLNSYTFDYSKYKCILWLSNNFENQNIIRDYYKLKVESNIGYLIESNKKREVRLLDE